jgi:hypothetical protein
MALCAALFAAVNLSAQTSGSWLDRLASTPSNGGPVSTKSVEVGRWNAPGSAIASPPTGPESRDSLLRRCGAGTAKASSAAAVALGKAGWIPFLHLDRQIARDAVEVLGGMAAASPGCEPTVFNLFVFVGNQFVGTLSPTSMMPNRDGVAGAVRLTGSDALTAEFARYAPNDPECCPSSRLRVGYRIDRAAGRPALVATEARQIR